MSGSEIETVDRLVERLRFHGRPATPVDDVREIRVLVESAHALLKERFAEEERCGRKCLQQFRPCKGKFGGNGNKRRNFWCNVYISGACLAMRLVIVFCLDCPRSWIMGKPRRPLLSCAAALAGQMVPCFSQHGGLMSLFTCFDRACFGPMSTGITGLAVEQWMHGFVQDERPRSAFAREMLICIAAPCSLHDVHNSAKWGVSSVMIRIRRIHGRGCVQASVRSGQ
eukprot:3446752-Amphidinium_carterae.3